MLTYGARVRPSVDRVVMEARGTVVRAIRSAMLDRVAAALRETRPGAVTSVTTAGILSEGEPRCQAQWKLLNASTSGRAQIFANASPSRTLSVAFP